MQENRSTGVVNTKGTDQLAYLHSLISAFVIHLLESIIILDEHAGLNLTLSETLKTDFLTSRPIYQMLADDSHQM